MIQKIERKGGREQIRKYYKFIDKISAKRRREQIFVHKSTYTK